MHQKKWENGAISWLFLHYTRDDTLFSYLAADVEVLLEGPLDAVDERLIKWVQEGAGGRLLEPSKTPYNIPKTNVGNWKESKVWKFYVNNVKKYFDQKVLISLSLLL